uniref:Uncharacterized protein n=1 Tax=Arundo donax TaxID=35708 RepID=A0A0A9DGU6_ARUDO
MHKVQLPLQPTKAYLASVSSKKCVQCVCYIGILSCQINNHILSISSFKNHIICTLPAAVEARRELKETALEMDGTCTLDG